jgi:hypothetical protein
VSPRGGKRVGAGRPKIIAKPVKAAFWVDREVLDRANEAARAKGTTVSQVVREALIRLAGGRRPRPRRRKEKYVR